MVLQRAGLIQVNGGGPRKSDSVSVGPRSIAREATMYQRILVPYDGSPPSQRALDEAIRLVKADGGRLRIVHRLDELSHVTGFETCAAYVADVLPLIRQAGEELLAVACARAAAAKVEVDSVLLDAPGTRLAEQIRAQALSWDADLIVIGSHGRRGAARFFIGSDAEQILRLAPVPALLVRGPDEATAPNAERTKR
jgi:nucleotide-binding universal stress UspA family protein